MFALQFQESYEGIIWRLSVDAAQPYIALLIRNKEDKTAKISIIQLKSYTSIQLPIAIEWLPDLIKIQDGLILLQFYPDPNLPQPIGIACYEAATGKQLWINYTDTYIDCYSTHLISYNSKLEPKVPLLRDLRTGTITQASTLVIQEPDLHFPEQISGTEALLQLDHTIKVIFKKEEQLFHQYIQVIDPTGIVLLEDILSSADQVLWGDSFFVFDNQLFYICHKQQLKIYSL